MSSFLLAASYHHFKHASKKSDREQKTTIENTTVHPAPEILFILRKFPVL